MVNASQTGKYVLAAVLAVLFVIAISPRISRRDGQVRPAAERKPMPDFRMPDMSGSDWRLSERRGRIVLVNFWATWCGPCRQETPALVNVVNELGPLGFEIAGVNMDDDPDTAVPPFAKRYRIPYAILLPGPESALAAAITSLPTSFLVDQQGRVARTYIGAIHEAELTADVRLLLKER